MVAGATGLLQVVANGSILLLAVCGSKSGFHLGGLEIPAKPAEGVLSTEPTFKHTGNFGHRLIILQSAASWAITPQCCRK
jgi:hypothetical protein